MREVGLAHQDAGHERPSATDTPNSDDAYAAPSATTPTASTKTSRLRSAATRSKTRGKHEQADRDQQRQEQRRPPSAQARSVARVVAAPGERREHHHQRDGDQVLDGRPGEGDAAVLGRRSGRAPPGSC